MQISIRGTSTARNTVDPPPVRVERPESPTPEGEAPGAPDGPPITSLPGPEAHSNQSQYRPLEHR